jgi:GDP-L-fucose synthase
MDKNAKIYIAGHNGMVGSAILRNLESKGYTNFVFTPYPDYDLTNQKTVENFFSEETPEYVIDAAAKVGGILANNTYRAQFIYENLMIQNNIIHNAHVFGVKKLLFLGSSCIYPRDCPQPIKEEYLLTGPLEQTNEPYAIAKIAGIKMCENYYRQYGSNFISVMPTNLYGPNDNFDLETSHVLPAIIRKMHLAKCLESDDWDGIRKDIDKHPIGQISGKSSKDDILKALSNQGIEINCRVTLSNPEKNNNSVKDLSLVSSVINSNNSCNSWKVTLTLWGTGKPKREFLYVDDMADACIFLMENFEVTNLNSKEEGFLNIGSGKDISLEDLAITIADIIGYSGKIAFDHSKPDGTPQKLLDVTKLKNCGWVSSIELDFGVRKAYESFLKDSKLEIL